MGFIPLNHEEGHLMHVEEYLGDTYIYCNMLLHITIHFISVNYYCSTLLSFHSRMSKWMERGHNLILHASQFYFLLLSPEIPLPLPFLGPNLVPSGCLRTSLGAKWAVFGQSGPVWGPQECCRDQGTWHQCDPARHTVSLCFGCQSGCVGYLAPGPMDGLRQPGRTGFGLNCNWSVQFGWSHSCHTMPFGLFVAAWGPTRPHLGPKCPLWRSH